MDAPTSAHCGSCRKCIDICPTRAIIGPQQLDARRCISYLTIEHEGAIPVELRPLIGNRIYGCDDCQLICPWNRHAQRSPLPDFELRNDLDRVMLLDLWAWTEAEFSQRTEGSAIHRIGYIRWRRNLAVAIGNGLREHPDAAWREAAIKTLRETRALEPPLVQDHLDWALAQAHTRRLGTTGRVPRRGVGPQPG